MRVLYHLSTIWQPLADALHYQNHDVIKILEKHGSKLKIAPMHVKNVREVPEYEISPNELDFTNGNGISKVCIYEYVSLSFLFEIFS
jgi:ankyrin repeat protein